MKKIRLAILLLTLLFIMLMSALLSGCVTEFTIKAKPIQRTEVPAYIEQVMGELCDSCRVTMIHNEEFETEIRIKCKKSARKIIRYTIEKAYPKKEGK